MSFETTTRFMAENDANKTQVGGTHYNQVATQHWDLVAANQMPYFEAQITRYITRWKKKNGAQDVLKAQHYLAKLKELLAKPTGDPTWIPLPCPRQVVLFSEFAKENSITLDEQLIFYVILTYTTVAELNYAEKLISDLHLKAVQQEQIIEGERT